jgi:glycosyltransferase involved in cell wall biosynthesis
MTPLLSILIPTLPIRNKLLSVLYIKLNSQRIDGEVEILTNDDTTIQIGEKRNRMLKAARGKYICFVDDDDLVSDNYVSLIIEGLRTDPDCCSLNGIITTDGRNPKLFKHSVEYKTLYEKDGIYYRPVNHLNAVRTSIAREIGFPDWKYSEDTNYAIRMEASGLLKTEWKIEPVIYFYNYISDKANHDYSK